MGSSNRHWPSLFKSKPTNNSTSHHHQWHHDLNNPIATNPYSQGCDDERTPEPKPRWNPRPEQIRILEAIFNSGMVNPPRDEIRRIRAQLQEFGQVGDANVFYWFQNRKSRSKHKQRHLQSTKPRPTKTTPPPSAVAGLSVAASSSSSSNKSSPSCNSNEKALSLNPSTLIDLLNSPTASVNQPFLQGPTQFMAERFFFTGQENPGGSTSGGLSLTHGICFPDLSENAGNCSNVLLGDVFQMNHAPSKKGEDDQTMKLQQRQINYVETEPTLLQGPCLVQPKSTVFINDVCFEVAIGVPFNVRETFGDDAVLVEASGQPVPTDEWGVTQKPLQHGVFYYLRSIAAPHNH